MPEAASIVPLERVEQAIYLIRDQKVMLDRELSREEIVRISQFVTSSESPDIKYSKRVLAFTEQGMAMLYRRRDELESKYDAQFRMVFEAIRELMIPPESEKRPIGFHVREDAPIYKVREIRTWGSHD